MARQGFRLFRRWKSRPGRPPIPVQLRQLICQMVVSNPSWGEERIANELLLKLGIRESPRTVREYMALRPPGHPRGDQRWSTFTTSYAARSESEAESQASHHPHAPSTSD